MQTVHFNGKQYRSWWSHLILIYIVCKGRGCRVQWDKGKMALPCTNAFRGCRSQDSMEKQCTLWSECSGLNCFPMCCVRRLFFGSKKYITKLTIVVNKFFWARLASLSQLGLISFKIPLWNQWFKRTGNIIYIMMKGSEHFTAAKHSLYTSSSKVLKSKHWQVHCLWM